MYTILCSYKITDENNVIKFLMMNIDDSDLSHLIPKRQLVLVSADQCKYFYMRQPDLCSNFFVDPLGELKFRNEIPLTPTPSNVISTQVNNIYNDLWHVIYYLTTSDAQIVTAQNEYDLDDNTKVVSKTYLSKCRDINFSTTHANCSYSIMVDAKKTEEGYEKPEELKKWKSIKIIENNILKLKTLEIVCSQDTLNYLRSNFNLTIFTVPMIELYEKLNFKPNTSSSTVYAFIDLTTLPIVIPDIHLPLNGGFIGKTVTHYIEFNVLHKLNNALLSYIKTMYPELNFDTTTTYTSRNESIEKVKSLGIKYSIDGYKSIMSVNKIFEKLQADIPTILKMDANQIKACINSPIIASFPTLYQMSIKTFLSNCIKLKTQDIREAFYSILDMERQTVFYQELMKQRLNYLRSCTFEVYKKANAPLEPKKATFPFGTTFSCISINNY